MKKALNRWLINWYQAADRPLPAWLERACQRDPQLARERQRGDALTAALSRRPRSPDTFAGSSSMADRVLRQITEEDYRAAEAAEKAEGSFGWLAFRRVASLAAVACLLAVGGIRWWQGGDEPSPAPIVAENHEQTPRLVVIETQLELPELPAAKRGIANIERTLAKANNPLDQEIEYMISDAKGALDFLADSFVPTRYRDAAGRREASRDDQA